MTTTFVSMALTAVAIGLCTAAALVLWYQTKLDQLRRALDAAESAAEHDPLTGLLNRSGLARAASMLAGAVVALVDLDAFKLINDQHGHDAGDAVLAAVAEQLSAVPGAIAGRLGGDEFVVVLPRSFDEAMRQLAQLVPFAVSLPDGGRLSVRASIGAATYDGTGGLSAAFSRADAAMYRAKATGTVVAVYDPRRDDRPSVDVDRRPGARVRDLRTAVAAAPAMASWEGWA